MKPLISIVIPVYNVEAYVEKCIRSCYAQDIPLDSYEVIVVNDGATDNSLAICKVLQQEFPQMKIISQENKGLSGARNTGMRQAIGEYIWFVDSDDWIEEDCLKDITENLTTSKPDLFWIGHDVISEGNSIRDYVPPKLDKSISGDEMFLNHLNHLFYIWKFIYRKEFLDQHSLCFYEGILYEDLEFTPRALFHAKSCQTVDQAFYHYLLREGSIANDIKPKNIEHRFLITDMLLDLLQSNSERPKYQEALINAIIHTVNSTLHTTARAQISLPKIGLKVLGRFKKGDIPKDALSGRLKGIILFPQLYLSIYSNLYYTYKILSFKS